MKPKYAVIGDGDKITQYKGQGNKMNCDRIEAYVAMGISRMQATALDVLHKAYAVQKDGFDNIQQTKLDDKKKHEQSQALFESNLLKLVHPAGREDGNPHYTPKTEEFSALQPKKDKPYEPYKNNYNRYDKKESQKPRVYQDTGNDPSKNGRLEKKSPLASFYVHDAASVLDYHDGIQRAFGEQKASDLEKIAYAIAAVQYDARKVRNYAVANTLYSIIAQEGYSDETGVGYFSLTVDSGRGKQRYTIAVQYDDVQQRALQEEELVAKELEALLQRISEKEEIDEKDITDTIKEILKNRNKEANLFIEEHELAFLMQSEQKIHMQHHDNALVLLRKEERTLVQKLRKMKMIVRDKKKKNVQKQKPGRPYSSYKHIIDITPYHYSLPRRQYMKRIEDKRKDFTHNVPAKFVTKFPKTVMGGVLGFTYLGENMMGIRDDLYGEEANEVEIHEAIHTDNEYETRLITKWMLDNDTYFH